MFSSSLKRMKLDSEPSDMGNNNISILVNWAIRHLTTTLISYSWNYLQETALHAGCFEEAVQGFCLLLAALLYNLSYSSFKEVVPDCSEVSFWLDITQQCHVKLLSATWYGELFTTRRGFTWGSSTNCTFNDVKPFFFSFSNCASFNTSLTVFCKLSPHIPSSSSNEPVDSRWIHKTTTIKTTECVVW